MKCVMFLCVLSPLSIIAGNCLSHGYIQHRSEKGIRIQAYLYDSQGNELSHDHDEYYLNSEGSYNKQCVQPDSIDLVNRINIDTIMIYGQSKTMKIEYSVRIGKGTMATTTTAHLKIEELLEKTLENGMRIKISSEKIEG